jgi:uncharacterized protein (DUF433 family)
MDEDLFLLPAYSVREAARHARISYSTARRWVDALGLMTQTMRGERGISYPAMVSLAAAAALRRLGAPFDAIRQAHSRLSTALGSPYPFARLQLYSSRDCLDRASPLHPAVSRALRQGAEGGRLAWRDSQGAIVLAVGIDAATGWAQMYWPLGPESAVVLNAERKFGRPTVRGVSTSVIAARLASGETVPEIAQDYDISELEVRQAVEYEQAA